jgi:hypothetical protein
MENTDYTYDINEDTNLVQIFISGGNTPLIFQESYPNGEPWEDFDAAEQWAQAWIAEKTDPEALEAPEGPGIEGRPKPVLESEEEQPE